MRARMRAQWLVLAAALTVLAGVLVAWGLARAADRVEVVAVARPVPAGTAITAADLTIASVAVDGATGLVPAASLERLAGRIATVHLEPGRLLVAGMWADGTGLAAHETLVGAVLRPGRMPEAMAQGSLALAVAAEGSDAPVEVRVVQAARTDAGARSVTLAVPRADAVRLAQLAAGDRLVLIGLPPTDQAATSAGMPQQTEVSP